MLYARATAARKAFVDRVQVPVLLLLDIVSFLGTPSFPWILERLDLVEKSGFLRT